MQLANDMFKKKGIFEKIDKMEITKNNKIDSNSNQNRKSIIKKI